MGRRLTFSISALFLLTLASAVAVRFLILPVPEGITSSSGTDSDGNQTHAEYFWLDSATALIENDFGIGETDSSWTPYEVEPGQNSVVSLDWGERNIYTTGGCLRAGFSACKIIVPAR